MGKACSLLSGRGRVGEVIKEAEQCAQAAGWLDRGLPTEHAATEQRKLTGKKRCVLVGCNYIGTPNELHGCCNDVRRMMPVLETLGFQEQKVLLDEDGEKPTRQAILEALDWLVTGAAEGDALVFHYSGHGGRERSEDGYHETLVPLDFETAGMLRDTELFEHLVRRVPAGCRLTCILDSCHSAGALNLPYVFLGTEEQLQKGLAGEAVRMAMDVRWQRDLQRWAGGSSKELFSDVGCLGKKLWHMYQEGQESGFVTEEAENRHVAQGEVVALTGCRSDQTSADVGDVSSFGLQGGSGGALSSALLEALKAETTSYAQLLEHMREELAQKGYQQVPQFVSSMLVDLKKPFHLDTLWVEVQ